MIEYEIKAGDKMIKGAKRILVLDEIRGFAILCMIIHHTFYNIGFVMEMDWGYRVFNFLCAFQPIFWAAFIITSGICSRLSRNPVKRGVIVLAAGCVVSFATAVIMPAVGIYGAEIYFGILSCLGCSMIITGLLMPLINKGNEKIWLLVIAFLFFATYKISEKSLLFGLVQLPDALYQSNIFSPLGFYNSSFKSADYFPLVPWLFMFLFGAVFGKYAKEERLPDFSYKSHSRLLQFVGKNSLWFYLAHQPALYAIMYFIKIFI